MPSGPLHFSTWEDWSRPGKAANYISKLAVQPRADYVIACRVSRRQQAKRGNLLAQSIKLREAIEAGGGNVVGTCYHVGSGQDPSWLEWPAEKAAEFGATLVAATTDRLVRSRWYRAASLYCGRRKPGSLGGADNTRARHCRAQEEDLRRLHEYTTGKFGVPLATYLDPDAEADDCRSLLSTWGREVKGKKGGRPGANPPGYKKRRRLDHQPWVLRLRRDGMSLGQIAQLTGVPKPTVQRWVQGAR
jgi:hypothetical protein